MESFVQYARDKLERRTSAEVKAGVSLSSGSSAATEADVSLSSGSAELFEQALVRWSCSLGKTPFKGTSPPMPARVAPPAWARPTALWLGLLALQPAPRDYHSQGLSGPLAHSPIRARKGTQTDCARRNPHERNIKNDTIGPTIAPYRLPTTVLAITV